jgi:hypothetical protein
VAVALPNKFVVIDDRGDAGTVVLDVESSEGRVLWVDSHATPEIGAETLDGRAHDVFPDFSQWVQCCVEDVAEKDA